MCSSKEGVSALQLSRTLEITYKSAWFLAHRVRKAMEKDPMRAKLTGTVEADETYVGGKGTGTQGGPSAGGTKIAVFTLLQRDGETRSVVVDDVNAKTLKGIIRNEVEGTTHIMTDQMASYHGLRKEFAGHDTVDHRAKEYVRGIVHINFSESYLSLFKRGIIGAFHHISGSTSSATWRSSISAGTSGRCPTRSACWRRWRGPRASGCSTARQSGW